MMILVWLGSIALAAILYRIAIKLTYQQEQDAAESVDPCESCIRWSECNGIDKDNCPLWQNGR